MPEVYLSASAQRKMQARGVTFQEVEWAALHPEVSWKDRSLTGKLYDVHQCGDIAVVLKHMGPDWQVVSVLWRNSEQWTDGEMFVNRVIFREPKTEKVTQNVRKSKDDRRK